MQARATRAWTPKSCAVGACSGRARRPIIGYAPICTWEVFAGDRPVAPAATIVGGIARRVPARHDDGPRARPVQRLRDDRPHRRLQRDRSANRSSEMNGPTPRAASQTGRGAPSRAAAGRSARAPTCRRKPTRARPGCPSLPQDSNTNGIHERCARPHLQGAGVQGVRHPRVAKAGPPAGEGREECKGGCRAVPAPA